MLIEDVACPVEKLGDMTLDLIDMFERYGYKDASCFGHALEGNLHLVFSQGFRNAEEVKRFSDLIDELCFIVATKHSGSLKVSTCPWQLPSGIFQLVFSFSKLVSAIPSWSSTALLISSPALPWLNSHRSFCS